MLDELLSEIPSDRRTPQVLNNIHTMIQRYRELRDMFSIEDRDSGALEPKIRGSKHKPLVYALLNQSKNLDWIHPITTDKRKLYDIDNDVDDVVDDIVPLTLAESRDAEEQLMEDYAEGTSTSENKYKFLLRSIATQTQPYILKNSDPTAETNATHNTDVGTSTLGIVNNLDDFMSSTVHDDGNLSRTRFYTQQYTKGFDILRTTMNRSGQSKTIRIPAAKNDPLAIKGFLSLPMSVVKYSKVRLPGTNIATQSELASITMPYWKMLSKKTLVTSMLIENDKETEYTPESYLQSIVEYAPTDSIREAEDFKSFLESMIPPTHKLFPLIAQNLNNKRSIYEVIQALEPFLIYSDDVSIAVYKQCAYIVKNAIAQYKMSLKSALQKFKTSMSKKQKPSRPPTLLSAVLQDKALREEILKAYYIPNADRLNWSNAEIWSRIVNIDGGRLYMAIVASKSKDLMIADGQLKLRDLDTWIQETQTKREQDIAKSKECPQFTIAKEYNSIQQLEADNGKEIYFDKKYDKTFYDMMSEYDSMVSDIVDMPEKIKRLSNLLSERVGMNDADAAREAKAMLNKRREVENGDYAIVKDTLGRSAYFKRQRNRWVPDKNASADVFNSASKSLCNMRPNCIDIDKCQTIANAKKMQDENAADEMLKAFDIEIEQSKQSVVRSMDALLAKARDRIAQLATILSTHKYKYDYDKAKLQAAVSSVQPIRSPYLPLRNIILGQSDFAKRQADISRFIGSYTRPASATEDMWWLYCVKTSTKLLPSFYETLATTFLRGGDYLLEVENICALRGTISDDGDAWVDKYSGHFIIPISFDTSDGYTDAGFKDITRAALEVDIKDKILGESDVKQPTVQFTTPQAEVAARVVSAVSKFMGVSVEPFLDFIVTQTTKLQMQLMPSKERYEKKMKAAQAQGKTKIEPYSKAASQSLIVIALSFLLVSFVSSTPPIRTKKRHPGCIRSFSGFPLDGDGDLSGLKYIACVANKIKSSIEPWDSIKRWGQSSIEKRMEAITKKFIVKNSAVKALFREKKTYMRLNKDEHDTSEAFSIEWPTFLPVINPIKVEGFEMPTNRFYQDLKQDMKKRDGPAQRNKVNILLGKKIYLAIKFQQHIQSVIVKKMALLSNKSNEPFLENACCDDGSINTFEYFSKAAPSIISINKDISLISNVLYDTRLLTKAPILYDPTNTKFDYPVVPAGFSEETIYRAFIYYCKYGRISPTIPQIEAICGLKPQDFSLNVALSEQINSLKQQGKNFDESQLQMLLQIINARNSVNINFYNIEINPLQKLREQINASKDLVTSAMPEEFKTRLEKLLDIFNVGGLKQDTSAMRSLKNYVETSSELMKQQILEFVGKNARAGATKMISKCIEEFADKELETNDVSEKNQFINYVREAITTLADIFPNIILNKVKYSEAKIPPAWRLSDIHKSDIKNIINKYYSPLYTFYGDQTIQSILSSSADDLQEIKNYALKTPYYVKIKDDRTHTHTIFDSRLSLLLTKYYFLLSLITYINSVDASVKKMLVKKTTIVLSSDEKKTTEQMQSSVESTVIEPDVEQEDTFLDEQRLFGAVSDADILSGETQAAEEKVGSLLSAFSAILCSQKKTTLYSYEELADRIQRSKEKEKDLITDYLKDMTDEEREIENVFKNNKLGRWNVGLQKGLRIYEKDTYDAERKSLEDQAILEKKLGEKDFVTDMNREIYMLDAVSQEMEADAIMNEEMSLAHLADDDDFGDRDGDEGYY